MRTKNKTCGYYETLASSRPCFYTIYNEQNKETKTIGDGSQNWMIYRTAGENRIKSTVRILINLDKMINNYMFQIEGYYTPYDGSGYTIDLYQNNT